MEDNVIKLHDIARSIEKEFGICKLSIELRKVADNLSELLNGCRRTN